MQLLLTLSCPGLEPAPTVGVEPDVHLPGPGKVVIGVIDVPPISVLVLNLVVPYLVDLERSRIVTVPPGVTLDDV